MIANGSLMDMEPDLPTMPSANSDRRCRRPAVTLLEMVIVVAIMGILALVAVSRLGHETFHNYGARAAAKRLALDLSQARRRSIATGEDHYLSFTPGGAGTVTGYGLYRRDGGGAGVGVEEPREFPGEVIVTASHVEAEFNFEGSALAAYQITLTGPGQTWQVDVVPATGTARLQQILD